MFGPLNELPVPRRCRCDCSEIASSMQDVGASNNRDFLVSIEGEEVGSSNVPHEQNVALSFLPGSTAKSIVLLRRTPGAVCKYARELHNIELTDNTVLAPTLENML